jgi:SAM-dependent methyltransferase
MDTDDISTYGERIAGIYDDLFSTYNEAMIPVLADLSGGGRALELGIDTGRIALPLTGQGIEVHGIDASPAMLSKLHAKPGGENIPVTLGNFADVEVEADFSLIYVVFNTFFGLLSQEEQIRCFRNAARRLTAEGVFLLELFVPDVARFKGGQNLKAIKVTNDSIDLNVSLHDPVQQRLTTQHVLISENGIKLYPVQLRYVWPAELDLMAQLAGLGLRHRWGNWQRGPFTSQSGMHISVYEKIL